MATPSADWPSWTGGVWVHPVYASYVSGNGLGVSGIQDQNGTLSCNGWSASGSEQGLKLFDAMPNGWFLGGCGNAKVSCCAPLAEIP